MRGNKADDENIFGFTGDIPPIDVDIRVKKSSPKTTFRKSGMIVNFTLLVIGAVVFFLCISAFNDDSSMQNSPLFIDLVAGEVYVKRGFDPDILQINDFDVLTDTNAMGWKR